MCADLHDPFSFDTEELSHNRCCLEQDRDQKDGINFISINVLGSQSGRNQKFPAFYSRKGSSINFLGPGKRLFPGGSPAGYPAQKFILMLIFLL